jgi:polysaccharide deacetylase family protein (PEP-CTERM system associated)
MNAKPITNALTVDVEDYFHVSAFADSIDQKTWASFESHVEKNTHKLLEIFDQASVSATFFVLGWVAERFPHLVTEITANGHELACHGYSHQLIYTQNRSEFREESSRAKNLLEDIAGEAVAGYRAASYSITEESRWAIEVLMDVGFRYDSSIVPVRHDLYGIVGARVYPYRMCVPDGRSMLEFPPSTIRVAGYRIPIGGGGYFRLFPYWFTQWGLGLINGRDQMPFSFYLHPWEIDPDQPRISAGWKSSFRHYNNLRKCEGRLQKLLKSFRFDTMGSVLGRLTPEVVDLASLGERGLVAMRAASESRPPKESVGRPSKLF